MAQFETKNNRSLKINGVDIWNRFNLTSIQIKAKSENIIGINRKLVFEKGICEKSEDTPPASIIIDLARVDFYNNPIPYSERELDELLRVIYGEDICTIECDGLLYYGTFSQGDMDLFGGNTGFISLPFDMCSPYAYTYVTSSNSRCMGEKLIELTSRSNVAKKIYVDIEIEQLSTGDITIQNMSVNNNMMTFKNMAKNEIIAIKGEVQREIYSVTNKEHNMFDDTVYTDFIHLRYGTNKLKIKGNDCKVVIKYQLPIVIR